MEKLKILDGVVLADSTTFEKLRAVGGESAGFSKFEVQHGYGKLIRVGATVQKGAKVTMHVDIKVNSYESHSYEAATEEVRTSTDKKVMEHLDETKRESNYSDWWLWFHSKNESEYEHHKQLNQETIEETDQTKLDALERNFSEQKHEYQVSGDFVVEGVSMVPTTAYLFVEILNIVVDEQSTTVINSNAVAATEDGDTSKVKIDGDSKLNILPILG